MKISGKPVKIMAGSVVVAMLALGLSSCEWASAESGGQAAKTARGAGEAGLIPPLTPDARLAIGRKIWKNECAGTVEGLVAWNAGENFASLGIGHFIWFPAGVNAPFHESFPEFVRYAESAGIRVPATAKGDCPWPDRAAFLRARQAGDPRVAGLQQWLAGNIPVQAAFVIQRARGSLAKIVKSSSNPGVTAEKIRRVASTPTGVYSLIDYINFKGEGLDARERYQGQGWGLLQVLEAMPVPANGAEANRMFAAAAARTLENRVRLSPPARGEKRWLPGWKNRCATYAG